VLVNPLDSAEVAAAIVRLLKEPDLAKRLGQNGSRWVESEMHWTRASDEFQRAMEFIPSSGSNGKGAA